MKRASTPDYSLTETGIGSFEIFQWSVVTIFYVERFVQYFWAAVVAEVEVLYTIWGLEH